jgi:hypothetical protein
MFTMNRGDGNFNPFHQLTYEYYKKRNRVLVGSRKVDEARHDGVKDGRREMYKEIFCAEVNRQRFENLVKWDSIPILVGGDARKPLQIIDSLWEAHVDLIPNGTKVDWESFYAKLDALVAVYVWSEEIRGAEADRHRRAVLDGSESPTEDDIAWITEEQGRASDEARRLAKLGTLAERAKETGA